MEVYRDFEGHLVYRTGPMGSGLKIFTVLGVLGCAAPFLLVGLLLTWWGLGELLEGKEDSWLSLAGGALPLIFGGALLAFFVSNKSRGSKEYRTTLKAVEEGLRFVFPDRVRGLLTGTEGREERAFLFRLIEAAWKANGLSGFEGPFGSRVLSP